jgi:type VI secretion system protein VasD
MIFRLLIPLVASAVLLGACAAPKPAKPVPAHAELIVSGDVNPDSAGRASPVVVRVYQLRNDGEFNSADFFAVYEKEKETLGASLVSREEYVLAPGESRKLELPLNAETRFVAVVAAYRDIRAARWRAISRPPEKKLTDLLRKSGITVHVDKDNVTLVVKD